MGEMDKHVDIKPEGVNTRMGDEKVLAAQANAASSPGTSAEGRRRHRLDRELSFSAPGPAFQMIETLQEGSPSGSMRSSMRHSRRTPKPSKVALESGMLSTWKASHAEPASCAPSLSPPSPPVLHPIDVLSRCKSLHEKLIQADPETLRKEHDALVRELFHLSKFVTMTSFDPAIALQDTSEVFSQFQAQYDLATKLSRDAPRLTRRTMAERRKAMGIETTPTQSAMPSPPPSKRVRADSRDKRRASSPLPSVSADIPSNITLVPLSSGAALDLAKPPPALMYTSPWQCPPRPVTSGGSLAAFFQSFAYWDEEVVRPEVRAQRIARESAIYQRIDEFRRQGQSFGDAHNTALAKLKPHEAPRGKAHWDFLLEGVSTRANRMRQAHRAHVQLAKKVSRMISGYWERTLHSDEREQKLELRRQRALAKWTMREVQKQWRLAVIVIRGRKQAAEKAEREKLGKKQLQAILEQSTQMLETQHADLSNVHDADDDDEDHERDAVEEGIEDDEAETADGTSTGASFDDTVQASDEDAESDDSVSDCSVSDAQLEREMWEEDEEDEDEEDDLQADAELPLEELMKKYSYPKDEKMFEAPDQSGLDASDTQEKVIFNDETQESKSEPDSDKEYTSAHESGASDVESAAASEADATLQDLLDDDEAPDRTLTKIRPPFLFRGTLRPYQQVGMEWLISLYNNQVNGILADEMGLGKTIQTIALLAHLACDRGNWGPHLIVAPTSVMLNWEMEFKKFLPGFKILSYFGSQKQRKAKRVGWNTPNSFHVCITSYQIVLADQHIFRRKPWVYLILDEAHHIKNFRSQRWQTLLGFNSERRLLLTGTPLQNNLMDLWSLMYFLMPQGIAKVAAVSGAFSNMKDFQDWFSNPLGKAAESAHAMDEETRATVAKLHTVLRPFVLRRLKSDVEQEMPKKFEHVMPCRLSKRQRFLYNDFMSRAKTRESLASGNYMSIINCLMQLRKVCNHPDLFEPRPIVTPFVTRAVACDYEIKDFLVRRRLLQQGPWDQCNLSFFHMPFVQDEAHLTPLVTRRLTELDATADVAHAVPLPKGDAPPIHTAKLDAFQLARAYRQHQAAYERAQHRAYINSMRMGVEPLYGRNAISFLQKASPPLILPIDAGNSRELCMTQCDALRSAVLSRSERAEAMHDVISRFAFATPPAQAPAIPRLLLGEQCDLSRWVASPDPLHESAVALQVAFPDASLLQYDCGKLQQLDVLMRRLVDGGHRALIFTQMTKVLDILEKFFNYHGYRYLRLDGATKVEQRQALTERFNRDPRISAFILSTRSGGLGINLVGADTVIFYDLDWNAAIEAQCMDRAHRIGQTRDVHIYRFVSEHTIEENMLRKANQKRRLDDMVIQQGEFTTEHLVKNHWRDMLDEGGMSLGGVHVGEEVAADAKDVEQAFRNAEDAEDAAAVSVANEEYQLDHADFEGDVSALDRLPPASTQGQPMLKTETTNCDTEAVVEAGTDVVDEMDEDDDLVGSIDDYMLRYVRL